MQNKVCFIGHRYIFESKLYEKLKDAIQYVIDKGYRKFMIGCHGEFDKLALSLCKSFRNEYKDIDIDVVLTSYHKIERKIIATFKNEFGETEEIADTNPYSDVKTTIYEIEELYFKKQITESNRKMIDECDTLICFVDTTRQRSGAKKALKYAKRKGLTIINCFDER